MWREVKCPAFSHGMKLGFLGIIVTAITLYASLFISVQSPIFLPKKLPPPAFTIVTGSSSNHFCQLKAWIVNMHMIFDNNKLWERPAMIVYDLGLGTNERWLLDRTRDAGIVSEVRSFNYTAYPDFFNINQDAGQFAWKPAIVAEVAKDYPGFLIWLDSGTIVSPEFIFNIRFWIGTNDGFFSPSSLGNMDEFTHSGVYEYYSDNPEKYRKVRNCNAAVVAFDTWLTQDLINKWLDCAMVKDCIAPPGSDLSNHRQDQSILTYLAARDNRYCEGYRYGQGIFPHEDKNCWDRTHAYEVIHGPLEDMLSDMIKSKPKNGIKLE